MKSGEPYSRLVAGVVSTKPGVILTEHDVDVDIDALVPMGVIGVIPTKVSTENGAMEIGDPLVTSSTPGCAMKADSDAVVIGTVIGKAMQRYDSAGVAKIDVLVNIK